MHTLKICPFYLCTGLNFHFHFPKLIFPCLNCGKKFPLPVNFAALTGIVSFGLCHGDCVFWFVSSYALEQVCPTPNTPPLTLCRHPITKPGSHSQSPGGRVLQLHPATCHWNGHPPEDLRITSGGGEGRATAKSCKIEVKIK